MEANLHRVYELEQSLLDLEKKLTVLKADVSKAKYDLRTAKADAMEYEGSLRSFLDRFRGTREAHTESLRRALRHAEETLPRLERALAEVQQTISCTKSELEQLPSPEDIPDCREKQVLEATLCLCALEPMLEDTLQAMLDCRNLEQGQRVGELISIEERQTILSKPVTMGMMCSPWLQRLEKALSGLDIMFQIPNFYCNPAAWLAATQYTRRDRLNSAIDQTLQMKKLLPQLKESLKK